MQHHPVDPDGPVHTRASLSDVQHPAHHHLETAEATSTPARSVPLISALALTTALLSPSVWAGTDEPLLQIPRSEKPWTLNLFFENDLFTETDRNYTNGIRASWVSPDVDDYLRDKRLPGWVRDVNKVLPLFDPAPSHNEGVQRNLVLSVGQLIFTPQDLNRTTVDPNDRPYAGWLYGGIGYHARTDDSLNSVELNLGIIGPWALGKEAQDLVHDLRGFDKFKGWDNQLENEPGFQLIYEHKNRWLKDQLTGVLGYDLILHGGGSIGNVATYLNAGAELRVGWRLPQDFGTSALRPGGDNSAPGEHDDRYSFNRRDNNLGAHLFISGDGRYVVQDIFLDGNTFENSHSVDKEPLVGEIAIGWAVLYKGWKFSFARIHRSREFKGQPEGHNYGSFSLSYSF